MQRIYPAAQPDANMSSPRSAQLTKESDSQRMRHPVQRRPEVAGGVARKGQQRDQHVLQDHVEPGVLGGAADQHEQGLHGEGGGRSEGDVQGGVRWSGEASSLIE